MSPVLTLFKIFFSVVGAIVIVLLSPILLIVAIIYFIQATFTAKKCEMCGKWFADNSPYCGTCDVIVAMEEHAAQQIADGPWYNFTDEAISHDMDIALAMDDNGVWFIGQGNEDPMAVEWKILGRDM